MAEIPYYDIDNEQIQNGGLKPKYDYDSEDFYNAVEKLAKGGATNEEIAAGLKSAIGYEIEPGHFGSMLSGNYGAWNQEETDRRSPRLREIVKRARLDINRIVKGVYLSTALGHKTNRTVTTVRRRLRIDGELTDNEEIQETKTIAGIPPNLGALSTWLYHHDKEWRKRQRGLDTEADTTSAPLQKDVKKGIDVESWLDRELMDEEENEEEEQ